MDAVDAVECCRCCIGCIYTGATLGSFLTLPPQHLITLHYSSTLIIIMSYNKKSELREKIAEQRVEIAEQKVEIENRDETIRLLYVFLTSTL